MILVKNISGRTLKKKEFVTSDQVEIIKDCGNCADITPNKSYNKLPDCCIRCLNEKTN